MKPLMTAYDFLKNRVDSLFNELVMMSNPELPRDLKESAILKDAIECLITIKNIFTHIHVLFELEEFLYKRWDDIKQTYLCYTSRSRSDITLLCCDIAQFLESESEDNKKSALQYLMPTIEHFFDGIVLEDIREKPLKIIVKSYILSDDSKTLIPISVLIGLTLTDVTKRIFYNPFLKETPLSVPERERLIEHSELTARLLDLRHQHKMEIQNTSNLYTEILKLAKRLKKGGEHGLHGGAENKAGVDAISGIIEFQNYWNHLGIKVQNTVLSFSQDCKFVMQRIFKREDYCVETLSDDLLNVAEKHKEILTTVGPSSQQKNTLLKEIINEFNDHKNVLIHQIHQDIYSGYERLSLNRQQIIKFIDCSCILNSQDITLLIRSLNSDEITLACDVIDENLNNLDSENLLFILLELNSDQLKSFVASISYKLFFIFPSSFEFGTIIDSLSNESFEAFLESVESILYILLKKYLFEDIYNLISDPKKLTFLNFTMKAYPDIMNAYHFISIYPSLNDRDKQIYFQNGKHYILTMTESIKYKYIFISNYFTKIYNILNLDHASAFLKEFKSTLFFVIDSSLDYLRIYTEIVSPKKNSFWEMTRILVASTVEDSLDFIQIYSNLNSDHQINFFNLIKNLFHNLIKDINDYTHIYETLPEDQQSTFVELLNLNKRFLEDLPDYGLLIQKLTDHKLQKVLKTRATEHSFFRITKISHELSIKIDNLFKLVLERK